MKKKLVKKFHEETRNFEARKNLKKDSPKKNFIQFSFLFGTKKIKREKNLDAIKGNKQSSLSKK